MREKIHQSTMEEIEARQAEVAAAECKGDGIHSNDLRFWHDWRLWERIPHVPTPEDVMAGEYHFFETWYCTRCRRIEERNV